MGSRRPLVMLTALALMIAGVAGFNYAVNPFGAWPVDLVNPIYRTTEPTRVAIPYLIQIDQPRVLIIGDSRAELGIPIAQGYRDGYFNAAMLGARLNELSALVKAALRNPKLRIIIWQLDFFSFGKLSESVYDPPTLARLTFPRRDIAGDTLLSFDALNASIDLIERSKRGIRALQIYAVAPLPWPPAVIRRETPEPSTTPFFGSDAGVVWYLSGLTASLYQPFEYSARQVDLFRQMVARIHRAGVALVIFLPPLSEYELEVIRIAGKWDDFMRFKATVAAIAPYADFSGYNSIARADFLYRDPMHLEPALGWTITRRLLGKDCSQCGPASGLAAESETDWNSQNAAANLLAARSALVVATRIPSKYSALAGMALEQYAKQPFLSALDQ
jgi:hypothetical protein